MKKYRIAILAILLVLLVSCASNVGIQVDPSINHVYGFWGGVWHGFILPVAWILSLFYHNIAIYAISNNGGWYDSGFIFGIVIARAFFK